MHSTTEGALNKMRAGLKESRRAGMSLIEVVLAIAVAGFVLTAATSFVVSVSSIWSTRAERHFFEDHVDGVMQFLQSSFDRAGIAIATERGEDSQNNPEENTEEAPAPSQKAPQVELETEVGSETNGEKNGASNNAPDKSVSLIQGSEEPISWERLPGASNYEDPFLSFELNALPPLFNAPAELPQLGGVRAYLHFDRSHGLRLLWHPLLQEEVEDRDDLRSTQLSALVEQVEYIYWDERFEAWEIEKEPLKGDGQDQFLQPRYLRFTFTHEGVSETRNLAIPVPSRSVFIF